MRTIYGMTQSEYVADAIARQEQTPNGHRREGWAIGPVGITRDSEPLERSNYRIALRAMIAAAGMDPGDVDHMPAGGPEPDDPRPLFVGSFGHWAVGWIEEIIWRGDNPELGSTAYELAARLDDYPVLDEEDYASEEWNDNHPDDGLCYANPRAYGPCGCGLLSVYCSGTVDYDAEGFDAYGIWHGPIIRHYGNPCPQHDDIPASDDIPYPTDDDEPEHDDELPMEGN